jgi:hypothetical protein
MGAKPMRAKPVGAKLMGTRQLTPRAIEATIQGIAKEQGLRRSAWVVCERAGTRAGQEIAASPLHHGATLTVVGSVMDQVEARLAKAVTCRSPVSGIYRRLRNVFLDVSKLMMRERVEATAFVEQHPHGRIKQALKAARAGALRHRAVLVPEPSGAAP